MSPKRDVSSLHAPADSSAVGDVRMTSRCDVRSAAGASCSCRHRRLLVLTALAVVSLQCTQLAAGASLPSSPDADIFDAVSEEAETRRQQRLKTILDRILDNSQQQDQSADDDEEQQQAAVSSSSDLLPTLGEQTSGQSTGRRRTQVSSPRLSAASWNRYPWASRMAAKRGPGICINSCLTGGMTFVRCKSMCH